MSHYIVMLTQNASLKWQHNFIIKDTFLRTSFMDSFRCTLFRSTSGDSISGAPCFGAHLVWGLSGALVLPEEPADRRNADGDPVPLLDLARPRHPGVHQGSARLQKVGAPCMKILLMSCDKMFPTVFWGILLWNYCIHQGSWLQKVGKACINLWSLSHTTHVRWQPLYRALGWRSFDLGINVSIKALRFARQ